MVSIKDKPMDRDLFFARGRWWAGLICIEDASTNQPEKKEEPKKEEPKKK
jgi:hypothetical protein